MTPPPRKRGGFSGRLSGQKGQPGPEYVCCADNIRVVREAAGHTPEVGLSNMVLPYAVPALWAGAGVSAATHPRDLVSHGSLGSPKPHNQIAARHRASIVLLDEAKLGVRPGAQVTPGRSWELGTVPVLAAEGRGTSVLVHPLAYVKDHAHSCVRGMASIGDDFQTGRPLFKCHLFSANKRVLPKKRYKLPAARQVSDQILAGRRFPISPSSWLRVVDVPEAHKVSDPNKELLVDAAHLDLEDRPRVYAESARRASADGNGEVPLAADESSHESAGPHFAPGINLHCKMIPDEAYRCARHRSGPPSATTRRGLTATHSRRLPLSRYAGNPIHLPPIDGSPLGGI